MNEPRYGFLKTSGAAVGATLNVSGPTNVSRLGLAGQLELQLRIERHRSRLERDRRERFRPSASTAPVDEIVRLAPVPSRTRMFFTVVVRQLGAGEVVLDDLVERVALLRVAVRAVLAHADPVAPAVPA